MNSEKRNPYSAALFYLGIGIGALGVFGSMILADYDGSFFIIGAMSTAFTVALILGFAEVINLLDKNNEYLRRLTEPTGNIEANNNSTVIEDLPNL